MSESLIGSFIAVVLFMLAHLIGSVWWASGVNTRLSIIQDSMDKLVAKITRMDEQFIRKEDMVRELAIAEKEHRAIWKNIDEIKETMKV